MLKKLFSLNVIVVIIFCLSVVSFTSEDSYIELSDTSLDLGEVGSGEDKDFNFDITNNSGQTLYIKLITCSCKTGFYNSENVDYDDRKFYMKLDSGDTKSVEAYFKNSGDYTRDSGTYSSTISIYYVEDGETKPKKGESLKYTVEVL